MAGEDSTGIQSGMCSSNVMFELWERASGNMSKDELEWFAGAVEHAEHVAFQLQNTVAGIGCLVSADGNNEGGLKAGNFQDSQDVSSLLFGISHTIADIRGLIQVGMSAQFRLKRPDSYKAET